VTLCVIGQCLVEEKVRQLQAENSRLHAELEQQQQQTSQSQQQTRDLQLVSHASMLCSLSIYLFTQPPMRRMRMFYSVFFRPPQR